MFKLFSKLDICKTCDPGFPKDCAVPDPDDPTSGRVHVVKSRENDARSCQPVYAEKNMKKGGKSDVFSSLFALVQHPTTTSATLDC